MAIERYSEMLFRMLGPVRIGGCPPWSTLPAGRLRGICAALVLDSPATVPSGRLAAALWDRPPRSAPVNIRNLVSQLRRCLDRAEAGLGDRLTTLRAAAGSTGGYRLDIHDEECDVRVFANLAARGHAATLARDFANAADLLRQALGLWTGPAGVDLPATTVLTGRLNALNESRLSAVEDYHHARLALGELGTLLPDVRALLVDHPFRERSWAHLLCTLYLTGDVLSALSAYDSVRHRLADELGIEPSPALRQLQLAVLRGDTDAVRRHCC